MATVNYSWTLPTVGASVNTWGTLLNTIIDDIDAKMVSKTGTQTLTNKTLTAPVVTGGITVSSGGASITGNVGVAGTLDTTGSVSFGTTSKANGRLTAQAGTAASGYSAFFTNLDGTYNPYVQIGHDSGGTTLNVSSSSGGNASRLIVAVVGTPITTTSSTGLSVTGTVSGTTNTEVGLSLAVSSGTDAKLVQWVNGGGTYTVGVDRTTGAYFGSSYAFGINVPTGKSIRNLVNNSVITEATSTGLTISGELTPDGNGTRAIGSTSLRWSQVWCTAGAFNTSDATLKTPLRTMQAQELAAGYQMAQELCTFQWLESVKEKGDKARRHVGLTVQRAAEILEAHGLDAWSYGFMGYDKWPAVTEIADATEEDEGAYQEKLTRQKTVKQTSQTQTVEVINGKPTLKVETVESDVPVTEQIQVVDADNKLVFTTVAEVPAVFDDEGNEVSPAVPAHMVPMMHAVPVMETVTVWKRVKEVRPAGESYAFRSDQLAFFIAAGVAAKVGA